TEISRNSCDSRIAPHPRIHHGASGPFGTFPTTHPFRMRIAPSRAQPLRGRHHERSHLSHRPHRGDHGHPVPLRPALSAGGSNEDLPVTMSNTRAAPLVEGAVVDLHWTPVVAGAVAAAGLAFVLHSFAIAIGLSVSSTAPTWRDTSFALVLLSGLYVLLVAV